MGKTMLSAPPLTGNGKLIPPTKMVIFLEDITPICLQSSLSIFFANLQDEVGKCWETQKSPPDSPGSFIWKVEKNLDIDPKYGSEDAIGCQKFAISIVLDGKNRKTSDSEHCFYDWIGCVGKIYRKPWFLPSNIGLSCKFSHHPILCFYS